MADTRFLWVDVDKPGELPALWGLLAERPCHLLVESAGSGGMHAYWQLAEPLPAVTIDPDSGERVEWIKRANLRLIHRIGTGPDGRPSVADEMCAEQARVMRLAGTINYKTGRYARLVQVDLSLAPYSVAELVGDLPDPPSATASSRRRPASAEKRSRGSLPANPAARVLREAGRRERAALRLCPMPFITAHREDRVVPRLAGAGWGLVVLRMRRRRRDLRPRLVSARRADRTGPRRATPSRPPRQLVVDRFGQLR